MSVSSTKPPLRASGAIQRLDLRRLVPIALGQAVGLVCGIIGVKITSQLIPPADYGRYGVFLSIAPLGMWVTHAGLIKFVSRHWAASPNRGGLLVETLRSGARKLPWLAAATLVGTITFARDEWWRVWPALFIASTLLSAGALAQAALQAAKEHWRDVALTAVGSISRTFLPPMLYVTAGGTMLTLCLGYAGHTLLFAIVGLWFLRRVFASKNSQSPAQLSSIYHGPLFVALAAAAWLLTAVNRWIVAGFFGVEAAGFFTLAGNIVLIVTSMLGVVFMQYFQPGLFAAPSATLADRQALARKVDKIALLYTALALVGVAGVRMATPWLIGPLIDEKYAHALTYLVGAGCFGAAVTTSQFFHVMLLAANRERACGPVDLSSAALFVGGGILAAASGSEPGFSGWLIFTPIIPWVVSRYLARKYLLV